jgi:hypothetical protein
LLPGLADQPVIELREIARQLRDRLPDEVQTLKPTQAAMGELQKFLNCLCEMEKLLLPKRKQRALEQFHRAVKMWARDRNWITSTDQADQIKQLLELFEVVSGELTPDWEHLADLWLELMRPRSAEFLEKKGRRASMMRLRDLESGLKSNPIEIEVLLKKLNGIGLRTRWEERIVACILGYGLASAD